MARVEAAAPPVAALGANAGELRRHLRRAAPLLAPVTLALAWEIFARSGAVTEFMLPPLSAVIMRIVADVSSGEFFVNAALTLFRTFTGFACAAVSGVVIGIAMARSRWSFWFFDPVVSIGFPMPKIAFLPVFILWFGLYDFSKITIIAINAVFPIITATLAGLQGIEREIIWSARSLGASERRVSWEIVVPAALPQILTGLQVALPTALIVDIVAEMLMGGYGLGAAMMEASRQLDSPSVFAGIIEIMVLGHCVLTAMTWLRRRLLIWHQESLGPTTL
jgi:ABC-type nitrate/sulfonate/bicarbonate transport system permease component